MVSVLYLQYISSIVALQYIYIFLRNINVHLEFIKFTAEKLDSQTQVIAIILENILLNLNKIK